MEFYYFLLAVSIILSVCKSSVYNEYAKRTTPTLRSIFGFNAASYGTAAAIALIIFLFGEKTLSLPTLICAFFYAAIVFSLQTLSVSAMKDGAMALTSICVMYGMIIPALAGPIFWHEPFGLIQALGILMMMLSLGLISISSGTDKVKISKKWIILAVLCFVFSGMAGVMEKIHQSTDGKAERTAFVTIACLFMLIFSVCARLACGKSDDTASGDVGVKRILTFGAISGAIIGCYSITNLTLAGNLDSMICYPISNGGALLLTVLVSRLFFKEALGLRRIIGVVIGLAGIILLGLPA